GGEVLPPDVRRTAAETGLAPREPWVLLLGEGDVVPPALADAVRTAVAAPDPPAAFRVPQEVAAFDGLWRLRRAPIRLARAGTPAGTPRAGGRGRGGRGGRWGPRGVAFRPSVAPTFRGVIEDLGADAAALAALWRSRRMRAGMRHLVGPPLAAAVRVLAAPAV